MNLETILFYVVLAGLALGLIGYVWLIVAAFRTRFWWGLGVLLGLPALIFIPRHWRRSRGPVFTMLLAAAVIATPYAINHYFEQFVDLGPRERIVDGELHITLTGWDGNYAILKNKPNVVVLWLANADVDDATLEHVRGFQKLRELDLNDTQLTDAGLQIISELPNLQEVRLRNTKITDEGFRKHLGNKEALLKVDVRGVAVASKTLREWKMARAGREYLR